MILILYQEGLQPHADQAAADLQEAYRDLIIETMKADASVSWAAAPSWDDLLIVMYDDATGFPACGNAFMTDYRKKRPGHGTLLPAALSVDPTKRRPPDAINDIKALPYDASRAGKDGPLAHRVGAMLGLRLQGRDARIFLSHRAADGDKIAAQLHDHMISLGYSPFLDEAKDLDGDTKIVPGSSVQNDIDTALDGASMLLLVDTPDVLSSKWIKHEVDTANASMLPVLPICFRVNGDSARGPRFRALRDLQRWEELPLPPRIDDPLTPAQLETIVHAVEQYLCEIFSRKRRVPFIVEREFVSKGFAWKALDPRLLMFFSSKAHTARLATRVLSHCSIFGHVYLPALTRFRAYLKVAERANHSLFIYDGELLPESELMDIVDAGGDPVIVLHHQELAELIHSNFTVLGKS